MVMYGVYNSDTLEDLIDTVHKLHNRTMWNEKLFAGQIDNWYNYYPLQMYNTMQLNHCYFLQQLGRNM